MEIMDSSEISLLLFQCICPSCRVEGPHNFHVIKGYRDGSRPAYFKCLYCDTAYKLKMRTVSRITPKIMRDQNVYGYRYPDSDNYGVLRGYKIKPKTFRKHEKKHRKLENQKQTDRILEDSGLNDLIKMF